MTRAILIHLLLLFAIANGAAAKTLFHLKDGSRIYGEAVEEADGKVVIEMRYGKIRVAVEEIEKREEQPKEAVIEEHWTLSGVGEPATLTRTVFLPKVTKETFSVPVEGKVTGVTNAEGDALDWAQLGDGPIGLLAVNLAGEEKEIRVTALVVAPLESCGEGCVEFSRVYTSSREGLLRITLKVPESWKSEAGDEPFIVERSLLKQERAEIAMKLHSR